MAADGSARLRPLFTGERRNDMAIASAISRRLQCAAVGVFAVALLASCATTESVSSSEPETLVAEAQTTLNNFLRDPDQTWVQRNLDRAKAVLIAPRIVKAGFIFGGSGGRALLVAKDGRTWVGPAFYNLATASVGFQAGVEVSEAVILVMTDKAFNSLMASSFKLGGDASIAAGPVGAGAKSDVTADLIAFTRSKGVYGGLNLDGTVVHANTAWNDAYYGGSNVLPPDILIRKTVRSPKSAALLAEVTKGAK
ncbi:MAG: lipid-binding SYLF domain-containing protein [Burkholderiales bacterium]|nr:lipid-binding SYLF domain-containing protein [Burkholderiales bacterium]